MSYCLLSIVFFIGCQFILQPFEVSHMKKSTAKAVFIIVIISIFMTSMLYAMRTALREKEKIETSRPLNQSTIAHPARVDRLIEDALSRVEGQPAKAYGYNMLCAAYLQKARETGDFSLNSRAEAALRQALEHEPDNREALTLKAIL